MCDIICCHYDNHIINSPITNHPFYDFAYIDGHWHLIDDSHAGYANHDDMGEITIIKSIHQDMSHFLEHQCHHHVSGDQITIYKKSYTSLKST